jgi:ABC-2 type transport system ATP-binding protein
VKPAIRVRHLWHRYGRTEVLRDVSFDVAHGEIFGFIGPNGAGKTTTIRVMATLLEPLAGRVEVDGWDVAIDPLEVRKIIGYMPDHAGVYERVTVREYLEFFADAYRVPEFVAKQGRPPPRLDAEPDYAVVDAVMELTDLEKLQGKLVATMSKGMKQRLQLARTLLHDPKVLILDEPASDLDPRARIEIRDLLVELRNLGKTVFLSSHILTELADVCTSVAILERGRLVAAGPIHEIARKLEAGAPAQGAALRGADAAVTEPAADAAGPRAPGSASGSASVATQPRRAVKIRALAEPTQVVAALGTVPQAAASATLGAGGAFVVTYVGDDRTLAELVRALVLAGVPVVGVEPERNELERIFLEVTRGEVQ